MDKRELRLQLAGSRPGEADGDPALPERHGGGRTSERQGPWVPWWRWGSQRPPGSVADTRSMGHAHLPLQVRRKSLGSRAPRCSGQAVRGGTQGFPTWSCLPLDPIWRPSGEGTQAWATRVPRTELTWPPSGHSGDSVLPFPDAKPTPDFCHLEDAGVRAEIPLCSEKNTTSGPSAPSVGTSSPRNVWACVRACMCAESRFEAPSVLWA